MYSGLLCSDSIPRNLYFFDFSVVPSLMLYSYMPAIISSFIIGIFVMIKGKYSLQSKILFAITASFSLWVLNYFFQWSIAYVTPDFLSWQLGAIFMPLMFLLSVYFVYVFLEKKDVSLTFKIISGILFLPILILFFSRWNIDYFNVTKCEGVIGPLWEYIYSLEAFLILFIVYFCFRKFILTKNDKYFRRQIIFIAIGATCFLLISWISDVLGEWTKQYQLNFIGPIGMVIFIGLLAYLIVKFKAFNIKLLATHALVISLIVLIGSQFFFIKTTTNFILTGITFIIAIIFGWLLIKSVQNEVKRKEELQIMADRLAVANDRLRELDNAKSEFISIASHQLRTPLTAIKGFVSLMMENSYGPISPELGNVLNKVYSANERLIDLVENLLNVSRIESGRIEYTMIETRLEDVIKEVIDSFMVIARDRGLYLETKLPEIPLPVMLLDKQKIKEVISNLIDNGLKYTKKGGVKLRVEAEEFKGQEFVRLTVTDTGVGIPQEEIPKLFTKFTRANNVKELSVTGTGLGLYVVKNIVEAHKGRIWIESEGEGRGTKFIVELPVVAPKS